MGHCQVQNVRPRFAFTGRISLLASFISPLLLDVPNESLSRYVFFPSPTYQMILNFPLHHDPPFQVSLTFPFLPLVAVKTFCPLLYGRFYRFLPPSFNGPATVVSAREATFQLAIEAARFDYN